MTDATLSHGARVRDHDDTNHSDVTPSEDLRTVLINKVAWGAVIAGAVLALVTQLFLNMVGVGVGAASLDVAGGANPSATSFSVGAGGWFALSAIIAALVGGYASGRLSGKPKTSTAGWHGLTTWAVTTLVVIYMLSSAVGGLLGGAYAGLTSAVGGAANVVGSTAQTAAQVAAPNLQGMADPMSSIKNSMQNAAGGNDPQALKDAAYSAMQGVLTGDPAKAEEGRARAADAIAKAQGIPVEDARKQVAQYEQQYRETVEQAKQKAIKAADMAAKGVSSASLLGALSLFLGAIAGWFGGRMGAVDPTVTGRARFAAPREP